MLNPYHNAISAADILALQQNQYQELIPFEATVAAGIQQDQSVQITSLGHFMLLSVTGDYTTKYLDEGAPADDGICQVHMQWLDGSNQRPLFDDFVPCSLILSPGRVRAVAGLGDASNPLRLEFPFVYTFPISGAIIVRIRNDSDHENRVRMAFKGIRIFSSNTRQG